MNTKPIILKVPAFEDFRGYLAVPHDKSVDFKICQFSIYASMVVGCA